MAVHWHTNIQTRWNEQASTFTFLIRVTLCLNHLIIHEAIGNEGQSV